MPTIEVRGCPLWKPDLEQIAEAVKNAPSIFNSQPWSLKVPADDRIELYARLDEPKEGDQRRWDLFPSADGKRQETGGEGTWRGDPGRHPRPLPWRFAELPQLVIRVGYAAVKANATPRRPPEILDARTRPLPGGEKAS